MQYHSGGRQPVPLLAAALPRVTLPAPPIRRLCGHEHPVDPMLLDQVRWHVKNQGWLAVGDRPGNFIYSVGLTRFGLPELVVRLERATPDLAAALMSEAVEAIFLLRRYPAAGQEWLLSNGTVRLEGIAEDRAGEVCRVARELFGSVVQIRALEMVPQNKSGDQS